MSIIKDLTDKELEELLIVNTSPPKEKIDLELHTVILTVGPTGCGKSHFCKNFLVPALKKDLLAIGEENVNVQYISSDDLRREVMGRDLHKHDPVMMHASGSAFELLQKKLALAMTWPTNAQFIIIDTTGFSDNFIKDIKKQAKENNYKTMAVVFDYEDKEEYYKYNENDPKFLKDVMNKHIDRMKNNTNISPKSGLFNSVKVIKNKNFDEYITNISSLGTYAGCFLDPSMKYDIISDIHGCYAELQELIEKIGYKLNGNHLSHTDPARRIVLVGDLIDKGPSSKEVLELVYFNYNLIKVVLGNHENFVYKQLNGLIKEGPREEIIKECFTCVEEFDNDGKACDMLNFVFEYHAKPFLRHPNFIVTHAPCKNKYLEKIDSKSRRMQMKGPSLTGLRDLETDDKISIYENIFSFIKKESVGNHPFHFFGHVSLNRTKKVGNKIFLDTGCVHGGKLTSANIKNGKAYYEYVHVKNDYGKNEVLIDIF